MSEVLDGDGSFRPSSRPGSRPDVALMRHRRAPFASAGWSDAAYVIAARGRFTGKFFRSASPAKSKLVHRNKLVAVATNSATPAKWCQVLWTSPIERNVFARIRRPLKLVAERIDRTRHRFAPGHKLPWSGLQRRAPATSAKRLARRRSRGDAQRHRMQKFAVATPRLG